MTARYLVGDVFDVIGTLPARSVDLVFTSPPFLALRSYLPDDHPDKHREIGSEVDPAAFVDTLCALTAELRRVLAPHGSIAVELGDTYSGSGGAGGDYAADGWREGQPTYRQGRGDWPLPKSACLVPQAFAMALAYGRNPISGVVSPAGRWRVRNVVRWCRPNPPVGQLGDKYRPATSEVVVACTSTDRYFDLDSVRKPFASRQYVRNGATGPPGRGLLVGTENARRTDQRADVNGPSTSGAPPLDYWVISGGTYAGQHYASFPTALVETPVRSMVPHRVCTTCGEPSRRIVDSTRYDGDGDVLYGDMNAHNRGPDGYTGAQGAKQALLSDVVTVRTTLGWSDCQHGTWRRGLVLDPFAGTGTVLEVAERHGHDSVGIDIDERNADLAMQRVGNVDATVVTPDRTYVPMPNPYGCQLSLGID